jgi:hypothetical protein
LKQTPPPEIPQGGAMAKYKDSLERMRELFGETTYNKLERTFKHLSENGNRTDLKFISQYYVTETSFKYKFNGIFGYQNPLLAIRFFKVLTSRLPLFHADQTKGFGFLDFLRQLEQTLFAKSYREQSKFLFEIYDVDGDGKIGSLDVLQFAEAYPKASSIGLEVTKLHLQIIEHQLKVKPWDKVLESQRISWQKFNQIVERSCLVYEL